MAGMAAALRMRPIGGCRESDLRSPRPTAVRLPRAGRGAAVVPCRAQQDPAGLPAASALAAADSLPLPPGEAGFPWFDRLYFMLIDQPGFINMIRSKAATHGIPRVNLQGKPGAILGTPDLLREGFARDGKGLEAAWPPAMSALLGDYSVFNTGGAAHMRLRRLLNPAFSAAAVKASTPTIEACIDSYLARWRERATLAAAGPQGYDVSPDLKAMVLEIAVRAVLGEGHVSDADITALMELYEKWVFGFISLDTNEANPLSPFKYAMEAKRKMEVIFQRVIEAKRAAETPAAAAPSGTGAASVGEAPRARDALSLMMAARDENGDRLSDVEIRDNLLGIVFAGHFTTASAASWAVVQLKRSPADAAAVAAEWAAWPAADRAPGAPLSFDALKALPMLEAFIEELVRQNNPAVMSFRKLAEDQVLGGHRVPKDWVLAFGYDAAAHEPQRFKDHASFCPMRFINGGNKLNEALPFGGGPRVCLGVELARLELRAIIVKLQRDLSFDLAPGQPEIFEADLPIMSRAPKGGVRILVR